MSAKKAQVWSPEWQECADTFPTGTRVRVRLDSGASGAGSIGRTFTVPMQDAHDPEMWLVDVDWDAGSTTRGVDIKVLEVWPFNPPPQDLDQLDEWLETT